MMYFYEICFLFLIGCTGGWILELFFRRFFSAKRWINPGFLNGPALPLYGFGVVVMYLMTMFGKMLPIDNEILKAVIIIILLGIVVTIVEYIAGLIFIKGMHIKLWDYSDRWGNIQGIICPLFSLFWLIICALYYFFLDKYFVAAADWLGAHELFLFFVGLWYGVFCVDLCVSFNVAGRIKKAAKDANIVVRYEEFKAVIAEKNEELKQKVHFILPFKSDFSMKEHIENYKLKRQNKK